MELCSKLLPDNLARYTQTFKHLNLTNPCQVFHSIRSPTPFQLKATDFGNTGTKIFGLSERGKITLKFRIILFNKLCPTLRQSGFWLIPHLQDCGRWIFDIFCCTSCSAREQDRTIKSCSVTSCPSEQDGALLPHETFSSPQALVSTKNRESPWFLVLTRREYPAR